MSESGSVDAVAAEGWLGIPAVGDVAPDAGVVAAAREVSLKVPLVVRLEGTNVELGKQILKDSGLPIISASDMGDAAQKAVAAVKGK